MQCVTREENYARTVKLLPVHLTATIISSFTCSEVSPCSWRNPILLLTLCPLSQLVSLFRPNGVLVTQCATHFTLPFYGVFHEVVVLASRYKIEKRGSKAFWGWNGLCSITYVSKLLCRTNFQAKLETKAAIPIFLLEVIRGTFFMPKFHGKCIPLSCLHQWVITWLFFLSLPSKWDPWCEVIRGLSRG